MGDFMKICYYTLQIELTRRCNQECIHCCRGECQNVDITKKIIDDFFNNNEIHEIANLLFTGGEPTLNGEMLEYFVDELIKRKTKVHNFILSINGLSYSEALVCGLNKLNNYILALHPGAICPGILMITQDQFHKPANPEVVTKLESLSYFSPIMQTYLREEDILPYGNAIKNHLTNAKPNIVDLTDYKKNMEVTKIDEEEFLMIEYQYIAANGNIINDGCQDYELMDKYALGNVETPIVDIYLKNKNKSLELRTTA